MAESYFIRRNGRVSGPHSSEAIKAAVKAKKLTKDDLVGPSNEGPWKKIGGATEQPLSNPKLTACEDCGGKVSKRAQKCPHCGSPQNNGRDWNSDEDASDGDFPPLPVSPHEQKRLKKLSEEAEEREVKKKPVKNKATGSAGLVFRIIIWVAVGMAIPVALLVTGLAWYASAKLTSGDRPREAKPNNAAQNVGGNAQKNPAARKIRNDLFASAHRAAIEYQPGGKRTLSTELKLIEHALETDDERELFKLFKGWDDLQDQQDKLHQYAQLDFTPVLAKVARAVQDLKTTIQNAPSPEAQQALQRELADVEENLALYTGVVAIMKKGGVITEVRTDNKWFDAKQDLEKLAAAMGAKGLAEKYKIPIQSIIPGNKGTLFYFPAEELRLLLRKGAEGLSAASSQMLNGKI